jgi:hypothetical protein
MTSQPAATVPRKRRKWPWFLGVFIVAVVIIAVSNHGTSPQEAPGVGTGSDAGAKAPAAASRNVVVYSVTGKGKGTDITYTTDGSTSMNQETNVALPWTKTISLPADQLLEIVQVSAQGGGESSSVNVTIKVNGKLVKQAAATGYGLASADYTIDS